MEIVTIKTDTPLVQYPRIWCFISGEWGGDVVVSACAIIDGKFYRLASHVSSSETWAKYDIGLTSPRKHNGYFEEFPQGFELEWVDDPAAHPVLSQYMRKVEGGEL